MIGERDNDITRCRRLGHEVSFQYCREEGKTRPCHLILNCWWERFDVRSFVRENYPPDVAEALEAAGESPQPSKVLSLVEMIEQAKKRIATSDGPSGHPSDITAGD